LSPSDSTLESRALALLDEALEQPPAERARWAEARTGDDPALRARLLALIAAADRGGDSLGTGGAALEVDDPPPPERIGAYRIVERVGQGGMGAVYRAERAVGDFQHTVAIKVIRPGVLSDALVERFQRERQTLADLAHPGIARLFDGGETPDGPARTSSWSTSPASRSRPGPTRARSGSPRGWRCSRRRARRSASRTRTWSSTAT
jgi:serine/threonine-protein kinase